jgi:membrane associated rhomboid family serine protease
MWLSRAMDMVLPGPAPHLGIGIIPRTWAGLWGIPIAPFIHANLQHLLSNTIPLLILGGLVVFLEGVSQFSFVFITSALIAGLGTWMFGAGNAMHIGASGVVFGFFGYLLFRSLFDRRIGPVVLTILVALLYGGAMLYSLIPRAGISWSGHFFGFIGGFIAAKSGR